MAGRGPKPKDGTKRQRRNKVTETKVDPDARAAEFPELPDPPPLLDPETGEPVDSGLRKWSPATELWYRAWCESPQASLFEATDWLRLHLIAPLIERYYATFDKTIMAEIRLNESKLGATLEDRQRMHMRIARAAQEEDADSGTKTARSRSSRPDPRLKLAVDNTRK